MPRIYIENRPHEAREGLNLLHACLELGFDIPYFCWHPAMHSVGACRQCAVKLFRDEKDEKGKIIMSCMTPVTEGMRISIDDPEVKEFRAGIIELLMMNHPHDCPVCDEGGECHLQDMTVMTGHTYRRFRFRKRTYRNQYLGPLVNHEMNRCIHCYRCVRFYRDYAGGRDLDAFASHHHVYFGRHEEGQLESPFSGNLVEVCPTGVFTDRTFKAHFTRKWDLQTAPSVCVHCGLGCNTLPGERYGSLRRILNRYNAEVNGYFLCDRGRFGYDFVNSERSLRSPTLKTEKGTETITADEVRRQLSRLLHFGAKVMGIGSPRASLEANYALRTLVGPERFCSGLSRAESGLITEALEILRSGPAPSASLRDAAAADAVFLLGEDILNAAPMLGLAVRRSVQNRPLGLMRELGVPEWNDAFTQILAQQGRGPLFISTPEETGLDEIAWYVQRATPADTSRLGLAVAHFLNHDAPPVPDADEALLSQAKAIADVLKKAERPLIISGTSSGSREVIRAAASVAWALCSSGKAASLSFVLPECNSMGLAMMEAPDLEDGFASDPDTVIILENDLYRRTDSAAVDRFLDRVPNLLVMDCITTATTARADLAIPTASFAGADGSLVSAEGRLQRSYRVFMQDGEVREAWRWLSDALRLSGGLEGEGWRTIHDLRKAMAEEMTVFGPLVSEAPHPADWKIPRQPHRYSGRTAMNAHRTVHEPPPAEDQDSPFSFSMEGYSGTPSGALLPRYWAPGWNSVQALNKFQEEIGGPLRGGDPGKRLIEPSGTGRWRFFTEIPAAFQVLEGRLLIVPLWQIFGSEELSSLAAGIASLASEPCLSLSSADASRLGVEDGMKVSLKIEGISKTYELPVRISGSLPEGVGGLPSGLPGLAGLALPGWGSISKGGGDE